MESFRVEVEWLDAHKNSALEDLSYSEDYSHAPMQMRTVGWLIRYDEVGVTVCAEKVTHEETPTYRGQTFVPAGMIVAVRRLSVGRALKPQ